VWIPRRIETCISTKSERGALPPGVIDVNECSRSRSWVARSTWGAVALFTLLGLVIAQGGKEAKEPKAAASANHYIGADKCKNCHQAEASGNQFAAWQKADHSKAFERLGSDEAKKVAKEKGIDDPQKSDKCLKCHTTAFGLPADMIKKGFDAKLGVQCESCHGPGEAHMKARFAAMASAGADASSAGPQKVPEGEIINTVDQKTCLGCHNDESPTFKPFCFYERAAKIQHLDPRKQHTKEQMLVCGCDKCDCKHGCDAGKCGAEPKSKK
jgi:hypothetical protein